MNYYLKGKKKRDANDQFDKDFGRALIWPPCLSVNVVKNVAFILKSIAFVPPTAGRKSRQILRPV